MTAKPPAKPDGRKGNGRNLNGRPKGVKNKTTIFKEVIRNGFEEELIKDFAKVYKSVVHKAIGPPSKDSHGNPILGPDGEQMYLNGDMSAAKLLFDRALPTSKAIDLDQLEKSKGLQISINLGSLEKIVEAQDAVVIEDGEIVDE